MNLGNELKVERTRLDIKAKDVAKIGRAHV